MLCILYLEFRCPCSNRTMKGSNSGPENFLSSAIIRFIVFGEIGFFLSKIDCPWMDQSMISLAPLLFRVPSPASLLCVGIGQTMGVSPLLPKTNNFFLEVASP
ncbi:MAG: hypothetical protein M1515_01395 [Candidatus Thermoplasmatota archaeon]|nr:hypothetical protein [Candidatus Thermoplasmatota archaeon]